MEEIKLGGEVIERGAYKYRSLIDTLNQIDKQIQRSLRFARHWTARQTELTGTDINDPQALYKALKNVLHYKKDPEKIELLQTMQSLMLDNYWGRPGYGDCDCFTITACSCLLVTGYPTGYTLYGNGAQPTHIASDVYVKNYGRLQRIPFDLVAPEIGRVRDYRWSRSYKVELN